MAYFTMTAYLKVQTKIANLHDWEYGCENGHRRGSTGYCCDCGQPNRRRQLVQVFRFPRMFFDEVLPIEYEDTLNEVNSNRYNGSGLFVVIHDGMRKYDGIMQSFGESSPNIIELPTLAQMDHSINAFKDTYNDILELLKELDIVESFTVNFGIVKDVD